MPFAFGFEPAPGAELTAILLALVPLAFASAIIRYRLMDVEVIIKRALVYAAALAGMAGIYGVLLKLASERYYEVKHALAEHGILAADAKLDLAKMLARKDKVVETLTKGIDGLFKKNKITRYLGTARLAGAGKAIVETKDGPKGKQAVAIRPIG